MNYPEGFKGIPDLSRLQPTSQTSDRDAGYTRLFFPSVGGISVARFIIEPAGVGPVSRIGDVARWDVVTGGDGNRLEPPPFLLTNVHVGVGHRRFANGAIVAYVGGREGLEITCAYEGQISAEGEAILAMNDRLIPEHFLPLIDKMRSEAKRKP